MIATSWHIPPVPLDLAATMITLGATALLIGAAMHLINKAYSEVLNKEAALSKTNQQLEAALSKVKVLGGLIPICSHCKKIRDDSGYWNQIESYLCEHSEADFSHSVCPECMAKYYADLNI